MAYEEGYYDETCGKNKEGKKHLSANIKGYSVDVDKVIKYGDDILMPAGFSKRIERKYDNGDVILYWFNVKDGGYVSLTVSPQNFMEFSMSLDVVRLMGLRRFRQLLLHKKTWSGYETTHSDTDEE